MATVDIRHNDTVKVIAGRDKGKQGRVLRVFPDKGKVLSDQGRHRGTGSADCDQQRAAALRYLRSGAAASRSARREESSRLRQVRQHAREKREVSTEK
jgi:hypothetical protein